MIFLALFFTVSAISVILYRRSHPKIPVFWPLLLMFCAVLLGVVGSRDEPKKDLLGESLSNAVCLGVANELKARLKNPGRILFLRDNKGDLETDQKLAKTFLLAIGQSAKPTLLIENEVSSEMEKPGPVLLVSIIGWNPSDKLSALPKNWQVLVLQGLVQSPTQFFEHPGALAFLRLSNVEALRAADDRVLPPQETYAAYFKLVTRDTIAHEPVDSPAPENPEEKSL